MLTRRSRGRIRHAGRLSVRKAETGVVAPPADIALSFFHISPFPLPPRFHPRLAFLVYLLAELVSLSLE